MDRTKRTWKAVNAIFMGARPISVRYGEVLSRRKETVFYHSEIRGVVLLKSPNSDGGMALSRKKLKNMSLIYYG
jgi:hypothetical protein